MRDDLALCDLLDLAFPERSARQARPRGDSRLLTIFRVGKLTTDRFEELCLVRSVGAGGMLAVVHSPLVPRQRVRIELREDHQLWGSILWIKDGTAGIAFDGRIAIDEVLARASGSPGRRMSGPRLNLDCKAKLRTGAGSRRVRVYDLGQAGMGVVTTGILEEQEEVAVTLYGLQPIRGTVTWYRDGRAGIAFNKPIAFHELTRWLQERFGRPCVEIRGIR